MLVSNRFQIRCRFSPPHCFIYFKPISWPCFERGVTYSKWSATKQHHKVRQPLFDRRRARSVCSVLLVPKVTSFGAFSVPVTFSSGILLVLGHLDGMLGQLPQDFCHSLTITECAACGTILWYIYISQNTAQVSEDWNGARKISHEKKDVGVVAHRAPAYGILSQWLSICANDAYSSIRTFELSQKQWLQYVSPHPSNNQRLSFEEQSNVQLCPDSCCIPGRIKAIWIERY